MVDGFGTFVLHLWQIGAVMLGILALVAAACISGSVTGRDWSDRGADAPGFSQLVELFRQSGRTAPSAVLPVGLRSPPPAAIRQAVRAHGRGLCTAPPGRLRFQPF